jgi:hypothetical protein
MLRSALLLGLLGVGMCTGFLSNAQDGASSKPAPLEDVPLILQAPRDQAILHGEELVLEVVATGAELQFQWQREGRILGGATTSILRLPAVGIQQAGRYSVRVYNVLGEVVSPDALVSVLQKPMVVRQPVSQVVTQGSGVTFELAASGTAPLRYQWFRNGNELSGETDVRLRLENVQAQDAASFSVRVGNDVGSEVSAEARLTVLTPPRWVSLAGNQTVAEGRSVSFAVHAEGTHPLSYQWYRNGEPLAGATGLGLDFAAARPEDDGTYTASVSNAAGREWSPPFRLRVLSPPRILVSPETQIVGLSNRVTLRAAVTGSEPLYFGWRRNGIDLFGDPGVLGPDSNTLEIPQVAGDQAGVYELVVCNFAGLVVTDPVEVRIETPPFIISPPQNQRVALFEELTLAVQAGGSPQLSYQWYHNGTAIPGATQATLGPIFVQQDVAGPYWVAIKNAAGSVVSDPVFVTVEQPRANPSDALESAPTLDLPIGCTIFRGSTAGFTREPGEPAHAGAAGGGSGWYRWRATSSAWVTLGTTGSDFDTMLGVYTGDSPSNLVAVASSEDAPGVLTSRLTFKSVPGVEYWIAVDGFDGDNGEVLITAIVEQADPTPLPVIVSSPLSGSGPAGRSTNLVVVAQGQGLTYQWYFLGQPLPGETESILHLTNVQPQHVGTYFVRVQAQGSPVFVDSARAVVEIGSASDVVSVDKRYFNRVSPDEQVPSAPPQLADVSTSAGTIVVRPGASADQILNNEASTWSSSDPRTCNWFGGATRWLTNIVVEKKGVLVVDSRDSAVPALTGLFAYVSARARLLACSQDGLILYTNETEGAVYDLMADSVQGQGGVISLKFSLIQLPTLPSTPPQMALQELNQPLVLDAGVTNSPVPTPTFQWFLNETNPIPNATGSILSLGSFQASDAGLYTVRIRTPLGDLTNRVAHVGIRYPAAWSLESIRNIVDGAAAGPLWARSASEAYLWVNTHQAGTPDVPEARLFRSASTGWELVLRVPRFRGVLVHGADESDVNVWLDRADGQTPVGLLLSSLDRGATWVTNSLPVGVNLQSARGIAGNRRSLHLLLTNGQLLRRQGPNWTVLVNGSQPPLVDLQVLDEQHGFAVTSQSLWKWDGVRWAEALKAPSQFLAQRLLAFVNGQQSHALVLGTDAATGETRLWNASAQLSGARAGTVIPDPIETVLPLTDPVGVWGGRLDRLFVVGRKATEAGGIFEFEGERWREVTELGGLDIPVALGGVDRDELWIPLRNGLIARRQTSRPPADPQVQIVEPGLPLVAGGRALLRAEVLGTGPFHYQWQFEGRDLTPQTNASLVLESLSLTSLGKYRVRVTAGLATVSAEMVLSQLQFPPRLLSAALQLQGYAGGEVTLVGRAEGDEPLNYQWFNSAGALAGESRPTLILEGLQLSDAGAYWVQVSNRVGVVTSDRWTVAVQSGFHLLEPRASLPHQIQGVADAPYVAERSSDLFTWVPWYTNQALRFAAPFTLLDLETKDAPRQFYRVRSW